MHSDMWIPRAAKRERCAAHGTSKFEAPIGAESSGKFGRTVDFNYAWSTDITQISKSCVASGWYQCCVESMIEGNLEGE